MGRLWSVLTNVGSFGKDATGRRWPVQALSNRPETYRSHAHMCASRGCMQLHGILVGYAECQGEENGKDNVYFYYY